VRYPREALPSGGWIEELSGEEWTQMHPARIEDLELQPPPLLPSSPSSHRTVGEIGLVQTPVRPQGGFARRLGILGVGAVVVANAGAGLRFRACVVKIETDGHGMDKVVLRWIAAEDGGQLVKDLLPAPKTRILLLPKDEDVIVSVVALAEAAAL
jgi:hypothetical protein